MWDQEASTNLWPRRSVVASHKPLFLKELSLVWENFPCYSAKNSLLLDNHDEKFERNPLGTCISVPEYSGLKSEDGLLVVTPPSSLCVQLMALAEAEDTQEYVLMRRGETGCPFFPATHPSPPSTLSVSATAFVSKATTNTPSPKVQEHFLPVMLTEPVGASLNAERVQSPPSPSSSSLLDSSLKKRAAELFLQLTRHPDEVSYWLRKKELPSTRALNLRTASLQDVFQKDFMVCEKTDGVRYCLLASQQDGEICLLDRAMEAKECGSSAELRKWLRGRPGDTVLDGELVVDMNTKRDMFIVFDGIVVDGKRVSLKLSLMARLRAAEKWLSIVPSGASTGLSFDIILKTQRPVSQIGEVERRLVPDRSADGEHGGEGGWIFSDELCRHRSDGLIFTPAFATYYDCMPYKWKPTELLTVDFAVSLSELARSSKGIVDGSVKDGGRDSRGITVCTVQVDKTKKWVQQLLAQSSRGSSGANTKGLQSRNNVILECIFDASLGSWRAIKERADKNVPNSVRTAFSTLEAVAEGLSLTALCKAFVGAVHNTEEGSKEAPDTLASYTPLSLSQLGSSRGGGGVGATLPIRNAVDPVEPMKQELPVRYGTSTAAGLDVVPGMANLQLTSSDANNDMSKLSAAASGSFQKTVALAAPVVAVVTTGEVANEVASHYDRIQQDRWNARNGNGNTSSLDDRIAVLRKVQNFNKACLIKRMNVFDPKERGVVNLPAAIEELKLTIPLSAAAKLFVYSPQKSRGRPQPRGIPFKVLELACGRGGDMAKWTSEKCVTSYVGVDISAAELVEASDRAKSSRDKNVHWHFHQSSGDNPSLLQDLYNNIEATAPKSLADRARRVKYFCGVNAVSCQFALHYFCGSEDSLTCFLRNVSMALDRGGHFCASFPNPLTILSHMNNLYHSQGDKSGNSVCYISPVSTVQPQPLTEEQALLSFGLAYK